MSMFLLDKNISVRYKYHLSETIHLADIRNCGGLLEFYLSEEERGRIEDLEKKLEIIIKEGYVGVPKTRANMLS